MAAVFTEGFETGPDTATITNLNSGYGVFSGTRTFDSTTRIAGSLSAKCAGNGTTAAYVRHLFTATNLRYFRRYFNVDVLPTSGNTVVLCRIRNAASAEVAQLVLISSGFIQMRNGGTIVATTTTPITLRSWFRVEWMLDVNTTSQESRFFYGANANGTTQNETLTGTLTTGTFDRAEEGAATNSFVGNVWIDEVVDDDATWPGPSGSATNIPVANAGNDQTVTTNASVQLDGTGSSDTGGSISAYEWRQISGTSVTLSSTTASQPTFTSPGAGGSLVFGLIVTDNMGVRSPEDTVTITVDAPVVAFTENFNGGTNGATITGVNTGYNSTITGSATFDSSTRINGALSAKLTASGAGSLIRHTFTGTTTRYFRRYLRINAVPASGNVVAICRVRNSSSAGVAEIDLNSDGAFVLKDGNTVIATSENTPLLNRWFRIEWAITSGTTQTLRLFLHGNVNGTTPTETLSGAYSGGTFDRAEEGAATNSFIGTVWVDAVEDNTGAWPGPVSDANQLPVANAGSDQQVLPFQAVTLDGSASSDAEGAVSYNWQQLGGTAVSLSSTTASQPTFTAPALEDGASLTFGLTVTDSAGMQSYEDITAVLVSPATDFVVQSGNWVAYETRSLQSGSWQ